MGLRLRKIIINNLMIVLNPMAELDAVFANSVISLYSSLNLLFQLWRNKLWIMCDISIVTEPKLFNFGYFGSGSSSISSTIMPPKNVF